MDNLSRMERERTEVTYKHYGLDFNKVDLRKYCCILNQSPRWCDYDKRTPKIYRRFV